jgi:hypothetical protein
MNKIVDKIRRCCESNDFRDVASAVSGYLHATGRAMHYGGLVGAAEEWLDSMAAMGELELSDEHRAEIVRRVRHLAG